MEAKSNSHFYQKQDILVNLPEPLGKDLELLGNIGGKGPRIINDLLTWGIILDKAETYDVADERAILELIKLQPLILTFGLVPNFAENNWFLQSKQDILEATVEHRLGQPKIPIIFKPNQLLYETLADIGRRKHMTVENVIETMLINGVHLFKKAFKDKSEGKN